MNNLIILILFIAWALVWSYVIVTFSKLIDGTTKIHILAIPLIAFITWISTALTWESLKGLNLLRVLQSCAWIAVTLGICFLCVKLMQKICNKY